VPRLFQAALGVRRAQRHLTTSAVIPFQYLLRRYDFGTARASAGVKPTHACPSHLTVDGRRGMAESTKRRGEILKEITELGKLQKEAVEDATFMGRSTIGDDAYEERARRISRLVSELVGLGQSKIA